MKNLCAQSLTINALMAFAARRKGGGKYALAHNYGDGAVAVAVTGIKLIVLASQLHKRLYSRRHRVHGGEALIARVLLHYIIT